MALADLVGVFVSSIHKLEATAEDNLNTTSARPPPPPTTHTHINSTMTVQ